MPQHFLKQYFVSKNFDVLFAKFVFYFFKIIGLLPISYTNVRLNETRSWNLLFKFSWAGIFYNVTFIIFLIYFDINEIYDDLTNNFFGKTEQEIFVFIRISFLIRANAVLILIVFTFQHSKLISFLNKINELWNLAEEPYIIPKKRLLSIYGGHFLILFILKVILIYNVHEFVGLHSLNMLIVYSLELQYSLILNRFKNFYELINYYFRRLKPSNSEVENRNLYFKIDKLMYMNTCLYDLSQKLSDFYSLPTISAISNVYIIRLICAYYHVKYTLTSKDSTFGLNCILGLQFYLSILSLIILVVNVSNTTKQVNDCYHMCILYV